MGLEIIFEDRVLDRAYSGYYDRFRPTKYVRVRGGKRLDDKTYYLAREIFPSTLSLHNIYPHFIYNVGMHETLVTLKKYERDSGRHASGSHHAI